MKISDRIRQRLSKLDLSPTMLGQVIDALEQPPTAKETRDTKVTYNEEQRLRRAEIRARRPER